VNGSRRFAAALAAASPFASLADALLAARRIWLNEVGSPRSPSLPPPRSPSSRPDPPHFPYWSVLLTRVPSLTNQGRREWMAGGLRRAPGHRHHLSLRLQVGFLTLYFYLVHSFQFASCCRWSSVADCRWSKEEQSAAISTATDSTAQVTRPCSLRPLRLWSDLWAQFRLCKLLQELAEWNARYRDKFGFVFMICASGRTAPEVLAELKVCICPS
jgi:hypothetical protein